MTYLRKRSWHDWPFGGDPDRAVSGEVNQYLKRLLGDDEMATAVARRKKTESLADAPNESVWGELSQVMRDNALKQLCCPTPSDAIRWKDFAKTNPTNEDLNYRLNGLWEKKVIRQTPPCVASSGTGTPLVWFGQDHTAGTPDLSGDELFDAVRRVMQLPPAIDETETKDASTETPKSRGKKTLVAKPTSGTRGKESVTPAKISGTPDKVSTASLLAGIEVVEERDVEYSKIQRSKHNPRLVFDQQLIADMEPNIESICRITPITLREGTLELIDGETRHRAGEKRKPALRCKIIRCTDAQAAAMRLLTAVQRRDLNPIEKAKALRSLQEEHGLSQRQLEDVVKLKQGTISNMTRMLDLPDKWQQRVISGEITPAQARELVPWKDEPTVLKEFEDRYKRREDNRWFNFSDDLHREVCDNSRTLKGERRIEGTWDYVKYEIKPTDEQRLELRIREVKTHGDKKEERAFNVALCEKLIGEIVAKKATAKKKKTESAEKAEISPAKAKENAKKQAEQLAKKLYRFRVGWYQAMCRDSVATDDGATEDQLVAILLFISSTGDGAGRRRDALQTATKMRGGGGYRDEYSGMLSAIMAAAESPTKNIKALVADLIYDELDTDFCGYHAVLHPQEIEALAASLGISIANDWTMSFDEGSPCHDLWDEFCGLWSKDQILSLLDEWKIKRPDRAESMKRADLAKLLTSAKGCPKAIVNAKPVRLS